LSAHRELKLIRQRAARVAQLLRQSASPSEGGAR
jgi:hypothetical protein